MRARVCHCYKPYRPCGSEHPGLLLLQILPPVRLGAPRSATVTNPTIRAARSTQVCSCYKPYRPCGSEHLVPNYFLVYMEATGVHSGVCKSAGAVKQVLSLDFSLQRMEALVRA